MLGFTVWYLFTTPANTYTLSNSGSVLVHFMHARVLACGRGSPAVREEQQRRRCFPSPIGLVSRQPKLSYQVLGFQWRDFEVNLIRFRGVESCFFGRQIAAL